MIGAAAWMQARGWRSKLAKRREYEQSLFEHSLIELDVLLALLPILARPRHYGLSEDEGKILAGAVPAERQAGERQWPASSRRGERGSAAVGRESTQRL